jgi:hypothetical protein
MGSTSRVSSSVFTTAGVARFLYLLWHTAPPPPARETFRDIAVKVHVRRPDKDTWLYLGRGLVSQELNGHSSRIGELRSSPLYSTPSIHEPTLRPPSRPFFDVQGGNRSIQRGGSRVV